MIVTINDTAVELPGGTKLLDALSLYSPYGGEPVIALRNGVRIAPGDDPARSDGDRVMVYPLLIGG